MKIIKTMNSVIDQYLFRRMLKVTYRSCIVMLLMGVFLNPVQAQERKLSLNEAIQLGLDNSKQLKLSQSRVDQAVSQYNQVKDKGLPSASASFAYNHAEILNDDFQIGGGNPINLPARADAYIGTASIQQLVFQGNKLKYATLSSDLLTSVARLDIEKDKQEITYAIINAYYNLYKVLEGEKVIAQNLQVIDKQIKQSERFFEQGIVTKNDVLRFRLQKSNIELTGLDLESNRQIVNYDLDVLLGLPDGTVIKTDEIPDNMTAQSALTNYIDSALNNREEIKQIDLRTQVAEYNIKTIKADLLPSLGVGASAYYINPSGNFFPPAHQFLAPVSLAATLSWNIGNLWTSKNKVAEAQIQKQENIINKGLVQDQVKRQVNNDYQNYVKAEKKIDILKTSIAQATENDKILESKYTNNVASVTDRIDANNQLFQSQINLELAKADAVIAYYTLLKSTGRL
jgi:outer membrane protein